MKTKQYYSTHEFANLIGVTSQTLRNWEKAGKLIPHHRGGGVETIGFILGSSFMQLSLLKA